MLAGTHGRGESSSESRNTILSTQEQHNGGHSEKLRRKRSVQSPVTSRLKQTARSMLRCRGQRCHAVLSAYGTFRHLRDSTRPVSMKNKDEDCHGVKQSVEIASEKAQSSDNTIFCLAVCSCLLFISDRAVPGYMFGSSACNSIVKDDIHVPQRKRFPMS